jgi:transposase
VDRADGIAVARPSRGVRQLEQHLSPVQPVERHRWSAKGVWWRIFEAVSDDPDFEYLIIDSTVVRAHQHAAGAKKGGLKIRPWAARAVA